MGKNAEQQPRARPTALSRPFPNTSVYITLSFGNHCIAKLWASFVSSDTRDTVLLRVFCLLIGLENLREEKSQIAQLLMSIVKKINSNYEEKLFVVFNQKNVSFLKHDILNTL